jgi:hypothetical protein
LPFKFKNTYKLDEYKNKTHMSASYIDREDFYRLRGLVANWGYEYRVKNRVWLFRFPNIELYSLDTLKGLDSAFDANPTLRTSF